MDKKGIILIILAVSGFIGWQVYYARQMEVIRAAERQQKAAAAAEVQQQQQAQAAAAPTGDPSVAAGQPPPTAGAAPVPVEAVPEQVEKLSTSIADYEFTNLGGGLMRATLHEHVVDRKSNARVVLNEFGSIPIGAISDEPGKNSRAPFTATREADGRTITFQRRDERGLEITKRFTLPRFDNTTGNERLREEYLLKLDVSFANPGAQEITIPQFYVHSGSAAALHANDQPLFIGLNYFANGENKFIDATWFAPGGFLFWKHGERPTYPPQPEPLNDVRFAGVTNQYFSTLITPLVSDKLPLADQPRLRGNAVWGKRTVITPEQWKKLGSIEQAAIDGAIGLAGFAVPPQQSVTRSFQILAGPREYRRLRELNNYEAEILDFGWFGLISKGLLNSMNFLKNILGSYWAAIILLTICIRTVMWPLQNRATDTAKKMQALSPKLKELQEKYKDDPMRMQQETTKMWKEYGINPFGGCLPMLIQIPIFFGFYNMLNKAVELRNSGFLWVQDLSQPDTVTHLLGFPLNPLPLLMAATMVWQMKLTPKAGDPMQQRILMFMPLIFIALCYNYAAALALYWTVQNLFSIVQLQLTKNRGTPELQKVAAAPVKTLPGKKKQKR